ncbi:UvrD-helicase domain-containing protein [Streptacidiphilus sp. N1-3]|uniref:UvrD-helicase domain-containing protein n=1 Tax=Streptacidiphilus alkalitolerans TaxID=3342712 RepID=A0ABV6XAT6_9ACTN
MYQTPRRLSELEAEAAAGAILLRAETGVEGAACQYRLYVIAGDHPAAEPNEQGRFLVVRVDDDGTVHEVSAPVDLQHQAWAETLLDRLWEGLEEGTLPGDGDGEQALVEEIVTGPDPEAAPLRDPAPQSAEADIVWTPTHERTEELQPGVRLLYRAPATASGLDADDSLEAEDLIEAIVRGRPDPDGDILVQDIDGDDEPYWIAARSIVSHYVPDAETEHAAPPRFRPGGQQDLAPSGRIGRIRANIAAVRVLHLLREEHRPATPDEQAVLARWSSWGAVPQVFDPRQREFAALRGELRSLLTEAEWHASEATVRNAHFTDASLVEPVWKALADMGFTGGRVLEPGSGSGNFIAFAPETAQMTGVELDPITAEISRALYPDAEVRNESFVATRYPDGYFDAAVGNVPFDEIALTDPLHNPLRLATHNHFIVKALELTRPGGLVAVLTSRYTLDSTGRTARLELADRADLVGAVRLPAGAHWAAAGTRAVTDLLILRRRDGEPPATPPDWVGLSNVAVDEETSVLVNSYFQQHPEMVLGTHAITSSQFTDRDITVRPTEGVDLGEALTQALAQITRQAHEDGLTMSASPAAEQLAALERRVERMRFAEEMFGNDLDRFEGTVIDQHDGSFLQIAAGELTERNVFKNASDELTSLLRLRDTYVSLLSAESTVGAEDGATALRLQLNDHYDAHTARFDFLNVRQSRRDPRTAHGSFRTDPYAAGVYALEIYDHDTGVAKKSAIFTKAVTHPHQEQDTAETPQDALAISLNRYREVRLAEIAELLGLESLDEAREALGDLVYNEPGTQRVVLAADYLSGDLGEKLEQVETILRMVSRPEEHPFQANAAALRATMPPPKAPGDIEDIQIGATWIAPRYYQDFIRQLLQSQFVDVTCESGADWEVSAPSGVRKSRAATVVYGTAKRNAVELFQRLLRRNSLVVHPGKPDEDASPEDIANGKRAAAEQTEQAVAKAEELNRLFSDWLWQDHERATDVLNTYNRRFNSWVPYQGDGSHLTFPGLSDQVVPRPHQRAGVARALHEGGHSFFDYEVGFGKTYTIAMTLMEMKRLGMVSKPCVVVKNPTVGDFRNDFLKCYPTARVLAIDSADFTKETASAYIAQIANGDWDAVILPQSLFKRIPVSGRGQEQFVADQTAEYRARIHKILTGSDEALAPGLNPGGDPLVAESLDVAAANSTELRHVSSRTKDTIKRLQGDLKRHTQRAEKNLVKNTMAGISWEQSGIDGVVVDEVQDFANAEIGANNSELSLTVSAQSRDLMVKLRNPANRVAIGSTGTPFPNAMPQAYVMLNYFRPDLLERAGLSAFSSFQAQYLTETMAPEISPEGIPRIKERIGAFRNAMNFSRLWKSMADVKTKDDIKLPVPEKYTETVVVPATAQDKAFMEEIADRAELVRAGEVDASVDNLLKISNDGRLAALDLRMVRWEPDGQGKLDAAVERIAAIYHEHKGRRYTDREGAPNDLTGALQLVFSDRGTPSDKAIKEGRFIAYHYLRDELVARGVPEDMIRFAQDANTAEEKAALFSDARLGKIAILVGSTDTMGVGVNVQDRALALHHLDCPWRPSDVTQREGRIVRQFNQHFQQGIPVQVYRWVKEGSFDSFMWQTVERKARFTDQVRTGRDRAEQEQALDGDLGRDYLEFGEIKAIATGNPLLLKQAAADEEVRQLEAAYTNWKRTEQHLRNVVDSADDTLATAQGFADLVGKAVERRAANHSEEFRAELPGGEEVTKRNDAASSLRTQLSLLQRRSGRDGRSPYQHVATLSGQMIMARVNNGQNFIEFAIRGLAEIPQASFMVDDVTATLAPGKPPVGLITRIENHINRLEGLHTTLQSVVAELHLEIERAQKLVGKPFGKMDRLITARAEQAQIKSDIQAMADGRARTEDEPAQAPTQSPPTASAQGAPATAPAEPSSADTSAATALPWAPPTTPYADRTESWAGEESMVTAYRQWADRLGAHLNRGSAEERSLAQAAELLLTESQGARQSRLLGFGHFTGLPVVEDLARQIRAVAEQWDRQQRGPQAVGDTHQLSRTIRDHASRYGATVSDPGSPDFHRWASTDEPVNVDEQAAEDAAALLDPLGQYTVTGPGGLSAEPARGADLAAGVAQLIADGAHIEQTPAGLILALAGGDRYEVADASVFDTEEPEPEIGADAEVLSRATAQGTDTARSSLPNIDWAAVVLGHYVDSAELVAGRELVATTGQQLQDLLRQQALLAVLLEDELAEFTAALAAIRESPQLSPEEVFGLYDRLALAASALVDCGQGEVASVAERLQLRTERHLARMQALDNNLPDELVDASALDPESLAVLGRSDPTKERPTPYGDSTHLNLARSILFQSYDRWPLVSGGGANAEAALRGAMWDRREMPDTRLTAVLPEWLQVVALAMEAADVADGETRATLRDVARRAFQHHQHLSAYQLEAAESSPYEDGEDFTQGAENLAASWETWLATATARELTEGDGSRPQDAPFTQARTVMAEIREALRSVELASVEDGTLDGLTRHTTKLAHTTYALALSLREETFRQRGDQQVLSRLVRTAYSHAAACRASSLRPAAVAHVRRGVVQRQTAMGNTPEAPAAAPGELTPDASDAQPLEIEHDYRATLVRGTTNLPADTDVRRLLDRLGFKYKGKSQHWILPRSGALADMSQRNERIRRLVQGLSELGRRHQMIETTVQESPVEIRIPVGEPYASREEAEADFQALFSAYWSLKDTPAGRRLMGSDGRPDGRAVHTALEELRQGPVGANRDPFLHPGDAVVQRCTELARAAQTISQHLAEEKYRAPAALPYLRTMTQYATLLASRAAATLAQEGSWQELFDTAANTAPEGAAAAAESAAAPDDVREPAVASVSGSTDPLLAGPYSGEELNEAIERLNTLVVSFMTRPVMQAIAGTGLPSAVTSSWEAADAAGRVALSNEESFAAALTAYDRALDATRSAFREMQQLPFTPATSDLVSSLIRETETHIVRLSLSYRIEEETREGAQAQRAREREAGDTAARDARIHEEARDWVLRAAADADGFLTWMHSSTPEEARSRFDEWLRFLVVTDPVSGAATRYDDWMEQSSRPGAHADIAADAFATLYTAQDGTLEAGIGSAAASDSIPELLAEIDALPTYEQAGPDADARLAVMATLTVADGTFDDVLFLLQSVEDSSDELDDEPVVRGAQILPPNNVMSNTTEGRWFAGDLLSMSGARVIPLREPIPWATVADLVSGAAEAALRVLSAEQTPASAEPHIVAEGTTQVQAETAHGSDTKEPAQSEAEAPIASAAADTGTQEGEASEPPRQRTREEALGLLPAEQYLGYIGRWGGDYDVAVPGGRYVFRMPSIDRQNISVRFMPDLGRPTDTVSVATVSETEMIMPRIRRHARRLAETAGYEEQALRLTATMPGASAAAENPGTPENPTELTNRETDLSTQEESMAEPAEAAAEGAWSSRIQILTEAGATFVTGTGGDFFPQEADLRNLLKKSGQNFAFREGRWRYAGRPANRERAVAEIQAYLRTKDAEAAAAEASKPTQYPPTQQQQRIIDAVLAGKDVAVQALAGTGKTSTLLMLTEKLPKKRIAYIAFNRAIADEARRKFPRRVTSGTSHSYARTALRNTPLWGKVSRAGKNGGARFPKDVAPLLGLTKPLRFKDGGLEPQEVARIALTAVRRYRESADAELGPQHLGERWANSPVTAQLLGFAQQIWDDKADPESNRMLFEPDDYIKLWALGSPRLPFDLIMFDEAQDINPVLEKVVADQQAQKIVVGDSHQAIYEFRGAIDALKDWPADETLPLTQSWRFGPEVAAVGNAYLRLLDADLVLEGNPALDTSIGDVDEPDAILTKTNIGAIGAVIEGFDQGKRVALVGGGEEIKAIAKAAQDLQSGRRTKHPELKDFTDWNEVKEFADTDEDAKALQTLVRLVDRYRPEGLLRMIDSLVPEDAVDEESKPELVVSTAHKSKGREWDSVRVGPDFPQPKEDTSTGEVILPAPSELRLAYVTVTRAKKRLELGSLDWVRMMAPDLVARAAVSPAMEAAPAVEAPETEPATLAAPVEADETPAVDAQPAAAAPAPVRGPQTHLALFRNGRGVPVLNLTTDDGNLAVREIPGLTDSALTAVQVIVAVPELRRPTDRHQQLVSIEETAAWLDAHLLSGAHAALWTDVTVRPALTEAVRDALRTTMSPGTEEVARWLSEGLREELTLQVAAHEQEQYSEEFAAAFATLADEFVMADGGEFLLWTYLDGDNRDVILNAAGPTLFAQLRQAVDVAAVESGTALPAPTAEEIPEGPAVVGEAEQSEPALPPAQAAVTPSEADEATQPPAGAELLPLPWDKTKIRQRGVAGLKRAETNPIPNLRSEIVDAVGRGQEVGEVWRQDHPWAQFHTNLRHVLAGLQDDEPASRLVEEIAAALQQGIEQIADRAATHYNGLIAPLAGDPAALHALDQQLVADNRIPEISNPFVREALVLTLGTLDEAEKTAASRTINSTVVRDALDQVVGLAGVRLHPGGESTPGVDAVLAAVEVQLDAARELIAELGLNGAALERYSSTRLLIADHEQGQAQSSPQHTEAAGPEEEAAHLAEMAEADSAPVPETEPLTDRDIAAALGRISDHDFGQWIFHSDSDRKHAPQLYDARFRMPAGPGEEESAETGSVWSRTGGMDITVSIGGTEVRRGRITWAKALAWLRPALTEQRKEILTTAWTTSNALARTEDAFRVIGEHDRYRAVRNEVQQISSDLVRTLIDESLQAHATGQAESLIARNRLDAHEPDDGLISLESLVDPETARQRATGDQTLEHLRTIRAVLPDRHTQHIPLSAVVAGDAFWSVSPQRLPFVAQGPAEVTGGTATIAGVLGLATGQSRPYNWVHDHTDLTQLVAKLLLPTSLAGFTDVAADAVTWSTDSTISDGVKQAAELPALAPEPTEAADTGSEEDAREAAPQEPEPVVGEAPAAQPAHLPSTAPEPVLPAGVLPYSTLEEFTADLEETRQAFSAWSGSLTVRRLGERTQELRSLTDGPVDNEVQQIQEPWLDLMLTFLGTREIQVQETAQRLRRFDEAATVAGRSLQDQESFADVADRRALQAAIGGARKAASRLDATAAAGMTVLLSDAAEAAQDTSLAYGRDAAPDAANDSADVQRLGRDSAAPFAAELAQIRDTHQAWTGSMTSARLTDPANADGGPLAARIQVAWEALELVVQDPDRALTLLVVRLRQLAEAVTEVGVVLSDSSRYGSPADRHVLLALVRTANELASQIEDGADAPTAEPTQSAPSARPEEPVPDPATTQAVAERMRNLSPSPQAAGVPDRSKRQAQAAWRTPVRRFAEGEGATATDARAFGVWYIAQGYESSKGMPREELLKLYEQWQRRSATAEQDQDAAAPEEQKAASSSTEGAKLPATGEIGAQTEPTTAPETASTGEAGPAAQAEATAPEPDPAPLEEPEPGEEVVERQQPQETEPDREVAAEAESALVAEPASLNVPEPATDAEEELDVLPQDDPGVAEEPWVDVVGAGIVGDTELLDEPEPTAQMPEDPARADGPAAPAGLTASALSGTATDNAAPSDQGTPERNVPTVPTQEEAMAEPATAGAVEPDELDRHFNSIVQALRSPAGLNPRDQQQLEQRYADLRRHLGGLLSSLDGTPAAQPQEVEPSVDAADAAELDAAIGAAQAEAGAYWGSPEWQSIRDVHQAGLALRSAVRETVMTHAEALVRDVRTHGLDRTIQAWTSRAVSHGAYLLARRLDGGGMRDSAAWRAVWRLHRAASTRADRLTGLLPAGQRIDLASQLRSAWQWLADRIANRRPEGVDDNASPQRVSLLTRGFEAVRGYYQAAADRIADLGQHPLWRRIVTAFESASGVLGRAQTGFHRLAADHATLGTGRMLWVRTLEIVAHSARSLLDRLERGGSRDGLRWNALRVLHHAAEEGISHLRGLVPENVNSPLGTYYDPDRSAAEASASAATPGAEQAVSATEAVTGDLDAFQRSVVERKERFIAQVQEGRPNGTTEPAEAVRAAAPGPETPAAAPAPAREAQAPVSWDQLREAADFVVGSTFAAELLLRRRLSLDSEQAVRVMGRLEEMGIVGPKEGTRLRPVLVNDREDVRRILARAQTPEAGQPEAAPAAPAVVNAAPAEQVGAAAVVAEAAQADPVSAAGLPQRQRSDVRPGPGQPRPAAVQQQPGADPGQSTQAVLDAEAKRLADRASFASSAASTPREQAAAANLQNLASKTQGTADLMAQGPAAVTPEHGAVLAEPFLAALRVQAAASGAALPEDVVQSAWASALKATSGKNSGPATGGASTGVAAPAAKGGQQQTEGRKAQQQEQQQEQQHRQQQQGVTPRGPRM